MRPLYQRGGRFLLLFIRPENVTLLLGVGFEELNELFFYYLCKVRPAERWTQESDKQPLAKAALENMAEVGGNIYSTLETYPPMPQSQAAVGQSAEKQN